MWEIWGTPKTALRYLLKQYGHKEGINIFRQIRYQKDVMGNIKIPSIACGYKMGKKTAEDMRCLILRASAYLAGRYGKEDSGIVILSKGQEK